MHGVGETGGMRCLGRAPLRFTPGLPGRDTPGFLPPQEPRDVRMTWSTNHRARAGGEQARGKEEGNPLGRSGVKRLPLRPLTATTNQACLPGALSTVTFPLKKKKILIWSFFCFQSSQGGKERWQQGPPPTPGATWQCYPASFESGSQFRPLQGPTKTALQA